MPNGKESTSVGHVDVSYQRGSEGCSQMFNAYRNIEILVYNPGEAKRFITDLHFVSWRP